MRSINYSVLLLLVVSNLMVSCVLSNQSKGVKEKEHETEKSVHQNNSVDYSWIVDIWFLETPFGTTSIKFGGNGTSGDVTELEDAMNPYSAKHGKYYVLDDKIHYSLDGEPRGISYVIEIQDGHRLHAGEGYYYIKARR